MSGRKPENIIKNNSNNYLHKTTYNIHLSFEMHFVGTQKYHKRELTQIYILCHLTYLSSKSSGMSHILEELKKSKK